MAAIGLTFACYAVWLAWTGILLPRHQAARRQRWIMRTRRFGTALVFVGLALAAAGMLLGAPPGEMRAVQTAAEHAMELGTSGRWAVGLVGVLVAGASGVALYHACALPLDRRLDLTRFRRPAQITIAAMVRVGEAARAMVIGLIACFLLAAAISNRAGVARGPTASMRALEYVPYGPWLLGLTAIGLAAYGTYLVIAACVRRVDIGVATGSATT